MSVYTRGYHGNAMFCSVSDIIAESLSLYFIRVRRLK